MRNGGAPSSTRVTSSDTTRAPWCTACAFIRSMSAGPLMASGNPGKFSMSVVSISWPPGSSVPRGSPSKTRGARLARAA